MNKVELNVSAEAINFARTNKKYIAKRLTDIKQFPSDEIPISVFMAV